VEAGWPEVEAVEEEPGDDDDAVVSVASAAGVLDHHLH
jgi:hypothetical protein